MIGPQMVDNVLERLGLASRPTPDLAGLQDIYGRWCRKVSFDNIRKRLALVSADEGPLPGYCAEDFFRGWLTYGTGGTCWAVSAGLHDLLAALGFEVTRAACTMLSSPTVRGPNHGTVIVTLEERRYVVDGAMLTERPLLLEEGFVGDADHAAAQVRVGINDEHWQVAWRSLHRPEGFPCRIDMIGVSASAFVKYYEGTRGWSPFNYSVYARTNTEEGVTGVAFGHRVTLGRDDQVASEAIGSDERDRFLLEHLGMAEELVARLPADEPLPQPPA
jgi:N-hydroxyarylamine O-acetyltransferase